ncbi:hypothetical protein KNP65_03650 [Latilactobacillus curvatus]|uniref:AbiU2 domain-containing protein n=1 Tax=Latilactobacillus curvatus TaxID=28038 RepID=UPI0024113BEC|nr:hypothetical protein [Latilactobacillus curvatus]MDG2979032.1 hypothetical protein [Latilactobacillus curvatus]
MNPNEQLEKFKESIDWLYRGSIQIDQLYSAVNAVSKTYENSNLLGTYGDFFAYSQNIMIDKIYLELSKLYVYNKDSLSLTKIFETANQLFSKEQFLKVNKKEINDNKYNADRKKLDNLQDKLCGFEKQIKQLKKLRNKNLAHLDRSISSFEKLEKLNTDNTLLVRDVQELISFANNSLSQINLIFFGIKKTLHQKDYTNELSQVANAIGQYHKKELDEINRELD